VRTTIRLLVVAALLNAVAQCGLVAMTFFQFQDASQEILLFGGQASPNELQAQILVRAKDLAVPIETDNVTVQREGVRTVAVATYTQEVELFPRVKYAVPLSFSVDALSLSGGLGAPASTPSSRR
jgi:Flp pilus assembly protein CpaB